MYFSSNVRHLRALAKLTQSQVAAKILRNRSSISLHESGSVPDIDTLIKYSLLFNVTIDDLLLSDLSSNENVRYKITDITPKTIPLLVKSFQIADKFKAVCITDKWRKIVHVNKSFTRQTGYRYNYCIGKNPGQLLHRGDFPEKLKKELRQKLNGIDHFYIEIDKNYSRTGAPLVCNMHVINLPDGHISFATFLQVNKQDHNK
jgi:PAS domain S-box-containing protein